METSYTSQRYSQPGISFIPKTSTFVTLHLTDEARSTQASAQTKKIWQTMVQKISDHTNELTTNKLPSIVDPSPTNITDSVIFGVDIPLWKQWANETNESLPAQFNDAEVQDKLNTILHSSPPYKSTGGDFYFHIKSCTEEECRSILKKITDELQEITQKIDCTVGNPHRAGKVYGRRMLHGLIASVDPINLSKRVLIGDEDPDHRGACFGLSQKFVHNWSLINEMSEIGIENMIGRDTKGNILPNLDKQSHLHCVRVKDDEDINLRIYAQGQTFGNVPHAPSCEEGVFVSAFAQTLTSIEKTLGSMLGKNYEKHGEIQDQHFRFSTSVEGNLWYIPSAIEAGLEVAEALMQPEINPFFEIKSPSPFMFYNTKDYLHRIWKERDHDSAPLTNRVINLLGNTFSRWHNNWYEPPTFPTLPTMDDYLKTRTDFTDEQKSEFLTTSIAERKGLAIKFTLGDLFTNEQHCKKMDLFRITSNELIVGVIPPFTLGTGVIVMEYLAESERLNGFCKGLDETSMAGHVVPGYYILLDKGMGELLEDAKQQLKTADEDNVPFYQSVVYALEGVQGYFQNYAALARKKASQLAPSQTTDRQNLEEIADRMSRLSTEKPDSFLDAIQLIFSMHCCMHLIGELVSLGRLDKYLEPFFKKDSISKADAQEIIDCFFIKMDEKVLMNRHYFEEKRSFGTCAIPYTGGPVPIGDKLSQWVMQVTVGGYDCCEDDPEALQNDLTSMFLRSARRLPLNSPCLSLRVAKDTDNELLAEASQAILSGGAAPFVYNDDLLIPGLQECATPAITKEDASNYSADGCWETILPGQTELGLSYIVVTNALELAINQGATYVNAGPSYIRGSQVSFVSKAPEDIVSFDELQEIFFRHYKWMAVEFLNGIFQRYGNLNEICPSPLLSSLIEGCLEDGLDLTNGGAKYHLIAPIIFGVPCVIDSLWAINKMAFDPDTAVTNLNELVTALLCDWGNDMLNPFECSRGGPEREAMNAMRFKELREIALQTPKFGMGNNEVDTFAGEFTSRLKDTIYELLENPEGVNKEFAANLKAVKDKYSLTHKEFVFQLTPSFGTFEDYIGVGLSNGATADGRRKGSSLCSNMSPMSSPLDLPPQTEMRDLTECLKGWNNDAFQNVLKVITPVDINIPESTPEEKLTEVLRLFSQGKLGSNMMSVTCADLQTMYNAQEFPERYDLLRMRMGGWSEFFIAMYDAHQEQHVRRPIYSTAK